MESVELVESVASDNSIDSVDSVDFVMINLKISFSLAPQEVPL